MLGEFQGVTITLDHREGPVPVVPHTAVIAAPVVKTKGFQVGAEEDTRSSNEGAPLAPIPFCGFPSSATFPPRASVWATSEKRRGNL